MNSAIFIHISALIDIPSGRSNPGDNFDFKIKDDLVDTVLLFSDALIVLVVENEYIKDLSVPRQQSFKGSVFSSLTAIVSEQSKDAEVALLDIDTTLQTIRKPLKPVLAFYQCAINNDISLHNSLFIGTNNDKSDKHAKFAKDAGIGEYLDINEILTS